MVVANHAVRDLLGNRLEKALLNDRTKSVEYATLAHGQVPIAVANATQSEHISSRSSDICLFVLRFSGSLFESPLWVDGGLCKLTAVRHKGLCRANCGLRGNGRDRTIVYAKGIALSPTRLGGRLACSIPWHLTNVAAYKPLSRVSWTINALSLEDT